MAGEDNQENAASAENIAPKELTDEERYKAYAAYAEVSRKWVSVMDAKAGFVAALNLGMLAFLWTGSKLSDVDGAVRWFALAATVFSLCSIFCAIWVAMPRESLQQIFGTGIRWHGSYKPISYYGFVALEYGKCDFKAMKAYADSLRMADLAHESLEQHFVISHSVARKSGFVKLAGIFLLFGIACAAIALLLRIFS